MDRSLPVLRKFDLSDQPDGRAAVWHVVSMDNTPGRELSAGEAVFVESLLNMVPWKDGFDAAFARNKKATLYEPFFSLRAPR